MLTIYKLNIVKYKAEMLANGTPAELIDLISGYCDVVTGANTIQEQLKTSGKNFNSQGKTRTRRSL